MKRKLESLFLMGLVIASVATQSHATLITYDDKFKFFSQTGATGGTGPLPDLGVVSAGSITLNGITIAQAPSNAGRTFYVGVGSVPGIDNNDWSLRLPGSEVALGFEDIDYTMAQSVYAFGFDFVEPQNDPNIFAPFFDSTFIVTLFDATVQVGTFSFSTPNDVAAFVGVWSSIGFNRIEVRDATGTVDNEFFGQVYTHPVPAPTTLFLLGGGLSAIVGARIRRRK